MFVCGKVLTALYRTIESSRDAAKKMGERARNNRAVSRLARWPSTITLHGPKKARIEFAILRCG